MKKDHSCQAGKEAASTTAAATESSAGGFSRMRSKLAFDRLVEMGAKMGMENPLFLCHERAAKATTLIEGKEYLSFSTLRLLDIKVPSGYSPTSVPEAPAEVPACPLIIPYGG